jgi:flavodoxin
MNVLVLYQSRSGHTRAAAEAIAQAARNLKHDTVVESVIQARAADIETADVLFVGTWVQGFILFGVKPAGADLWVPSLPSLEGKPVGVFCTYAFSPRGSLRTLATMLETRGATVLGQQAFHRRNPHNGTEQFAHKIVQLAERTLDQ